MSLTIRFYLGSGMHIWRLRWAHGVQSMWSRFDSAKCDYIQSEPSMEQDSRASLLEFLQKSAINSEPSRQSHSTQGLNHLFQPVSQHPSVACPLPESRQDACYMDSDSVHVATASIRECARSGHCRLAAEGAVALQTATAANCFFGLAISCRHLGIRFVQRLPESVTFVFSRFDCAPHYCSVICLSSHLGGQWSGNGLFRSDSTLAVSAEYSCSR